MRRTSQQLGAGRPPVRDCRSVAIRIFAVGVAVSWLLVISDVLPGRQGALQLQQQVAVAPQDGGSAPEPSAGRQILKLPIDLTPPSAAGPGGEPQQQQPQQLAKPAPPRMKPRTSSRPKPQETEKPTTEEPQPTPPEPTFGAGDMVLVPTKEPPPWLAQGRFDPKRLVDQVLWVQKYSDMPEDECAKVDAVSRVLDKVTIWGGIMRDQPRLFCGIYTYSANHDTKVRAVKETWASRCDGFVAFSDTDDLKVPTLGIKHEGPEEWNNMWQKVRAIWQYIHHHYRSDYDWFVMGGDDMFIIAENMRKYLLSKEFEDKSQPFYLGMRLRLPTGAIFNAGGGGYVLNVAALDKLMEAMNLQACKPQRKTFAEDVQVAMCLRAVGVRPYDTKDELGEERFHPLNPMQHLLYRVPKTKDWYAKYTIGLKIGMECCSKDTVSWHYMTPELMRRAFHLLYTCKLS